MSTQPPTAQPLDYGRPERAARVRRVIVRVARPLLVLVLLFCVVVPIARYLSYRLSSHTRAVLNGVGRRVEFTTRDFDGQPRVVTGTLTAAHLERGDAIELVRLRVEVTWREQWSGGSTSAPLGPFETRRVKFLD